MCPKDISGTYVASQGELNHLLSMWPLTSYLEYELLCVCVYYTKARLEEYRHVHDKNNQHLEAKLDTLLDRLRQGATQEVRAIINNNNYCWASISSTAEH